MSDNEPPKELGLNAVIAMNDTISGVDNFFGVGNFYRRVVLLNAIYSLSHYLCFLSTAVILKRSCSKTSKRNGLFSKNISISFIAELISVRYFFTSYSIIFFVYCQLPRENKGYELNYLLQYQLFGRQQIQPNE